MTTLDHIQPFQLEASNLRGRMARLAPTLDAIIKRHNYPPSVAVLLGETLTLAALLSGMLKFDGVFTLQAKGNGAVSLLVVDVTSSGGLRGYAQFDESKLSEKTSARALLGEGYMAFTVDQGETTERYQGLVELEGETLTDFIQYYFRQSEQIDTAFKVAVDHDPILGWRSGGLMLQRLPELNTPAKSEMKEDDWRRVMMLMSTLTPDELTSPKLTPHEVLYRLFHEEEVRVFEPQPLNDTCRCSREKVADVLRTLPKEDMEHLLSERGFAEVCCQFCSRAYHFTAEEVKAAKA